MITPEQIDVAKTMWEQARQSANLAHECWSLLIQSRKALLESFRQAGFPLTQASKEFEALMEDHAERYKTALEHMDNMARVHGELLEQFKRDRS